MCERKIKIKNDCKIWGLYNWKKNRAAIYQDGDGCVGNTLNHGTSLLSRSRSAPGKRRGCRSPSLSSLVFSICGSRIVRMIQQLPPLHNLLLLECRWKDITTVIIRHVKGYHTAKANLTTQPLQANHILRLLSREEGRVKGWGGVSHIMLVALC